LAKDRVRAARLGVGAVPISISGLADAHVSDWQKFPIGGGSEGRVELPLGQGNLSGLHPGVELGAAWPTSVPNLMLGGEIGFYPGAATFSTALTRWTSAFRPGLVSQAQLLR
jgi:hypothetical protein